MTDQNQELEFHLAAAIDSKQKIEAIVALAREIRYTDYERALSLAREVKAFIPELQKEPVETQLTLIEGLRILGSLLVQGGEYDEALQVYHEAYPILIRHGAKTEVVDVLIQVGRIHLYLSEFVSALQYTLDGLEQARELDDKTIEARLFDNLGAIYILREEFTRALSYLLRASKEAEEASDFLTLGEVMDHICLVYCGLNNPGSALNAGLRGLNIFRDLGDLIGEARVLNSLGRAYQTMKDFPRALECYQDALIIARRISLRYEIGNAQLNIAAVFEEQGIPGQSLKPLHEALDVCEAINARGRIVECHQALSSAYRKANHFQRALLHYENFHEIKQLLFNDETETRIKNLEVMYQVEQVKREAEQEQVKNIALQQEIEERIEAQRMLQAANDRLQKEIVIREQLIADLNAFARMVAHDLKTPLQNVVILTHLLQVSLTEIPNTEQALDLVKKLQQTGQKSGAIIHELLTLASLRNQDVNVKPLDMQVVLSEVYKRISFVIEESGAQISQPPELPTVYGHAPWVEEVWSNYLVNAIKYGGNPPMISLGAMVEDDGFVRFWVQDNGDGIDPEDQSRLFQAFTRLDESRVEGHGLGLSIVQRIVEKLGGKVGVESRGRQGEGSRFWFTLRSAAH
jgi:signal transduction histidine kinase